MTNAWFLRAAAGACLVVSTMTAASPSARDIFTNEGETRRPAEDQEFEIALGLNGCAGELIAPNVGLSAAHCKMTGRLKSGVALRDQLGNDGTIGKTIEIGSVQGYDYWIFEIKWTGGSLPAGMRVVPYVQTEKAQVRIGENETADKIFTLGFPADLSQGTLIHSWGYGKKVDGQSLVNNISLINGNSGGGIWRADDEMLVSVVSGGPHAFGQSGWKNNDWNDESHWNWGPAMYQVYAKSKTLRDIFPGGKNKYLRGEWRLRPLAGMFLPSVE